MKSITIHGMDDQLEKLITQKARSCGLSMNKTIKRLLEEALGIKPKFETIRRDDFVEFCGVWSKIDLNEFEKSFDDLRKINDGDWE